MDNFDCFIQSDELAPLDFTIEELEDFILNGGIISE